MTSKADIHADLEKVRRHQRILVDLGRLGTQSQSVQALLKQACSYVSRAVEVKHVKILRYRGDRGDLLLVAGVGWKSGVVGNTTFALDLASPPGRAFRIAQPVVIDNINEAPDYRIAPSLAEHGIISLLNVPILVDGAVWGVCEVDSEVERAFSQDTVMFCRLRPTSWLRRSSARSRKLHTKPLWLRRLLNSTGTSLRCTRCSIA